MAQYKLYKYIFSHQHSCGCLNQRTLWRLTILACGKTDISIRRVIFCARHLNFRKIMPLNELFKTSFSSKMPCPCFFYLTKYKQVTFTSKHNFKKGNRQELFAHGHIVRFHRFYVFPNTFTSKLRTQETPRKCSIVVMISFPNNPLKVIPQ